MRQSKTSPWVFGLLSFGSVNGLAVALPYILRGRGIAVLRIESILALLMMPSLLSFLWAPLVDLGISRKRWILVLSLAAAVLFLAAFDQPLPDAITLFVGLSVVGCICSTANIAAIGGLASGGPVSSRAEASGWIQVGTLGGMGLAAAVYVWASDELSRGLLSFLIALTIVLPLLLLPWVQDIAALRPKREVHLVGEAVRQGMTSRKVWRDIVVLATPIGTSAMVFQFPMIAADFSARTTSVWIAAALASLSAAGAPLGAKLASRLGPRRAYAYLGLASATSCLVMASTPLRPASYLTGTCIYAIIAGACWAAATVIIFEAVGTGNAAASTWYSVLACFGNTPIVYMLGLDGMGYHYFGVRGMLAADAIPGALCALTLLICLRRFPDIEPTPFVASESEIAVKTAGR